MRIAVAQINATLGAFEENSKKIISYIKSAEARHCDLVIFPECTLFGYHPFDLLERSSIVEEQLSYLKEIQKNTPAKMSVLVGVIAKNKNSRGRPYHNSAVLLKKTGKPQYFHKQLLPTGDVFDEARFIQSGEMKDNVFEVAGKKVFLTICEDIWAWPEKGHRSQYLENPIEKVKKRKFDLILNMSASPYYPGKIKTRKNLVAQTAKFFKAPMIYCNLVGAQDEIVFDGASFALDAKGKTILQCLPFEEELNILDLKKNEGGLQTISNDETENLRQALVLGIKDFCSKTGLQKIHFGLSGGIDSAVVACLAVDAIGASRVAALALPTQFNQPESLELARALAKNIGISFQDISIQSVFQNFKSLVDGAFAIKQEGLVHENLQSRIRGTLLMAYSNHASSLLLNTSNKSEIAAGYSTLYGDLCGGLSPIGDLTKDQVYDLARLYNRERELIPKRIIDRPPTAELRENQKDEDSLPPYSILDKAVRKLVESSEEPTSATDKWLQTQIYRNEFKRWQAPPILKVSRHSFGRGRRFPIAHKIKF